METFRLIFEGKRCGDYAKLPLTDHLLLLKFSPSACEKISNSRNVTLKRQLKHEDAKKQQQRFFALGLETSLKLELNPELFKLGYFPNTQTAIPHDDISAHHESSIKKPNDRVIHIVDDKFTDPNFFSRPRSYSITNELKKTLVQFTSTSYSFRGVFLLAISAYMGIILQSYMIVVLLEFNLPNLLTTCFGIAFLIIFILGMPKVLQPLQYSTLTVSNKKLELIDEFNFIYGKQTVNWVNHDSNTQGHIQLSLTKASAYDQSETYQWDAEQQITSAQLNSIDDIQSEIIDGTIVGSIISLFEKAMGAFNFFVAKNARPINWEDQTSSVITNSNNEIVALIYVEPKKAYCITKPELNDDPLLHAFCLYIQRNRFA